MVACLEEIAYRMGTSPRPQLTAAGARDGVERVRPVSVPRARARGLSARHPHRHLRACWSSSPTCIAMPAASFSRPTTRTSTGSTASTAPSCRTTTRGRSAARFAGCTCRSAGRRASSFASSKVRSSTWPWTFGAGRRPSGSGWAVTLTRRQLQAVLHSARLCARVLRAQPGRAGRVQVHRLLRCRRRSRHRVERPGARDRVAGA